MRRFGARRHAGAVADIAHHCVRRHVAKLGVEIAVIGAPSELAVGCELEPETLLQRDGLFDRAVLGRGEIVLIDLAPVEFLAQRQESGRTQQDRKSAG